MIGRYTPGPWGDERKTVIVRGLTWIAHAHYPSEEGQANAKLIEAAPELLEAAQMGVIWLTAALNCTSWVWDGDQREAAEIELAKMQAAIAKTEFKP